MRLIVNTVVCLAVTIAAQSQNSTGMPSGNIGIGSGATAPGIPLQVHNPVTTDNVEGGTREIAKFTGDVGNFAQFKFLLRRHTTGATPGGGWENVSSRLQGVIDVTNQGYLEFNPKDDPYGVAIGSGLRELMRFKENGNVGIGTTNPEMLFEVRKDQTATTRIGVRNSSSGAGATARYDLSTYTPNSYAISELVENGGNPYYFFGLGAGVKAAYYDAPEFNFRNMSGATSLKLTATGNIGIGTTSPEEKLHINGFALAKSFVIKNNSDNVFQTVQGTNWYQLIGTYEGWDPTAIYIAGYNAGNNTMLTTQKVFIGNTASDKHMSVNLMNGKVGIGTTITTEGDYRLYVEKGIRTRKVKVDQASWADYVFEPSYKLMPLAKVEAFIKANKHLPEVPSAKEVATNGVDLGDTQTLLLKKIEELTLYMIELKKENEEIKAELKTIKRSK
jgi:hypothetical protein